MKQKRKEEVKKEKHDTTLGQEMDEDFMSDRNTKRRSEKVRNRQQAEDYVDPSTSGRILRAARQQQQEIENERDEETGVAAARRTFSAAADLATPMAGGESDSEEDGGFSDTESQYEEMIEEEVTEEDERIMARFLAQEDVPQRTLADMIMAKIKEKETEAGIAPIENQEERTLPGVDGKVIEVYRGVGKLLTRYKAGKVPKAFKIVPSLSNWEEILWLTEPENWSPNAIYAATRLFASNLNARMAQRFYSLVLLPRIRQDIKSHKRLHFALYQALKKAVYKPSAFYKGLLLPLCQSRTCNLREAFIIGSVLQKVSIPVLHSSVALMKIADMKYAGTNSYFMKLLLDKKYALPYRVIDAVVAHFMRFTEVNLEVPVIWHQCLLTFIQRYKNELSEEDKENLKRLMRQHRHYLVTPEIQRELQLSRSRGQKDDGKPIHGSVVVTTSSMDEDYRSLPDVGISMDED